ncbi:MAG TPA: ABC transporter permease [Pseudomonadota bacterium]|nr:ABC transporter permease [Pseudomonadota bacterium]HND12406.1 ABC transporter permease [Pseudomonadota bacterium]HNI59303.1 ABC transporter permease [Pseudomonadota bacterium]HNK47343.1 ABC transporter permease [Pseudomonadota bacterium]HNO68349.1 ABC transporter permease [Pseudomonadota bacterium]
MLTIALLGLLWSILRISVPYVMATLGGTVCEKAGVINIALEGILLLSALGTALGAPHGALVALVCGLLAGVATALLYGLLVVVFRGDQIVCGVAIFMLADGLSRYLLKVVFGSTSNSPRLDALVGHGPLWLLATTLLATLLLHGMIHHSVFGLRLRAVGDKPAAAQALSVSVLRVRLWAVLLSGLLTAVGGVYLVFEQRQFVALMSGGRGFLALAAMIFGGWRPLWGAAAALLFATAEATGIFLQARGLLIPNWLLQCVPYVITLLSLMLRGLVGQKHSSAPLALGIPRP